MIVTAKKEQIDNMTWCETVTIDPPIMENIEKLNENAREIVFHRVQIEQIVPYGAGASV